MGILAFILRELHVKFPAVNIKLLKNRNLALGIFFNGVMGALLYIAIYAFPLMAQINLGWTTTLSGLALVPGTFISIVGMAISKKMLAKGVSPRTLMIGGFICTFIFGLWMCYQSPDSSWWDLFYPLLFRGLGIGLFMLPVLIMALEGLRGAVLFIELSVFFSCSGHYLCCLFTSYAPFEKASGALIVAPPCSGYRKDTLDPSLSDNLRLKTRTLLPDFKMIFLLNCEKCSSYMIFLDEKIACWIFFINFAIRNIISYYVCKG
jgi:hypothetical protein